MRQRFIARSPPTPRLISPTPSRAAHVSFTAFTEANVCRQADELLCPNCAHALPFCPFWHDWHNLECVTYGPRVALERTTPSSSAILTPETLSANQPFSGRRILIGVLRNPGPGTAIYPTEVATPQHENCPDSLRGTPENRPMRDT